MNYIVHVNQHVIRANKKKPPKDREAPLRLKTYKLNVPCNVIEIPGPCRVVYRPDKPLKCGATVWIETTSQVKVVL